MENKELATSEKSALVPMQFDEKQVELIKKTIAKNCTNDELSLFLYTCKRTGLDPLARQIYAVKRGGTSNQMTIQTSIDGYRLIADRTGKYAGNDDPIYDNEEKPTKATVTVHKLVNGLKCAFTATARWSQYYPGDAQGFMWKKMPHLMLGKCAESLALRKAFPAELAGVYTQEEMDQAGVIEATVVPNTPQRLSKKEPTVEELKELAEKKRAEFYAEDKPKDEPETNHSTPNDEKVLSVKGVISVHFPPKGKGPHSFKVGDYPEYLKTFDKEIADILIKHKIEGDDVEVTYEMVTKGEYTNAMITGVSIQAENRHGDAQE